MTRAPIAGPSVWRPADLARDDEHVVGLGDRHRAAFAHALAEHRRRGLALEHTTAEHWPFAAIAGDLADWQRRVLQGSGLLLLRGLARAAYTDDDLIALVWGIGAHLGRAVSQSAMGDRIGHVRNVGDDSRRERGYRTRRELALHTDSCEIVAMVCLQPASRGGLSRYASAHLVYNLILATRPELLVPLFDGFPVHRKGTEGPGEPPITGPVPVFSEQDGALTVVYQRAFIELAASERKAPLSERQVAALDYFDQVARDVTFEHRLQAGELVFFNNCTLLHGRTRFEDEPGEARPRHLVRLWLMLDGRRPLAPAVRAHKRTDGVPVRARPSTCYAGEV